MKRLKWRLFHLVAALWIAAPLASLTAQGPQPLPHPRSGTVDRERRSEDRRRERQRKSEERRRERQRKAEERGRLARERQLRREAERAERRRKRLLLRKPPVDRRDHRAEGRP